MEYIESDRKVLDEILKASRAGPAASASNNAFFGSREGQPGILQLWKVEEFDRESSRDQNTTHLVRNERFAGSLGW